MGTTKPTQKADVVRSLMNHVRSRPAPRMRPAVGKQRPLSAMAAKFEGTPRRTCALTPLRSSPDTRTGNRRKIVARVAFDLSIAQFDFDFNVRPLRVRGRGLRAPAPLRSYPASAVAALPSAP